MIQNSIDGEELYVLADGDEIAACVIANDESRRCDALIAECGGNLY